MYVSSRIIRLTKGYFNYELEQRVETNRSPVLEMVMVVMEFQKYRKEQIDNFNTFWNLWVGLWLSCLPRVQIECQIISFPKKPKDKTP